MTETPVIHDPLDLPEKKALIDNIIAQYRDLPGATMVVLNSLQEKIGYLTKRMQTYIANELHVPVSKVHGVVSFYSFFTTEPRGEHVIKFCIGTACYVGGASQLIDKAKQILGIEPGQTTADGMITLEVCRCVGACSQAPVVVIDEVNHGRLQPSKFSRLIQEVQKSEVVA
ncbi:MAG: NAD(P)H-dependent oxidoreductase subunit E [Anaerolineaceae bacterium]|jgi:NADH:ubiquinone oxidoreductase subunit E|nr:NAD(P)H-dependent oxidoreductase subunit E [Anaerolineaceae bacterium]HNX46448.1 NAD(P)H-dependent oxidoreductase subunit E [Anaerolineaceae bacterium]HPT23776.1 NAD(P)H-dependent oxidoreductase subunit E [Anaerolineaceae bacterium]